jgi:hypothetical protein
MLQKFTTSVMYNNKTEEEENSYLDICSVLTSQKRTILALALYKNCFSF